MTLAIPIQRVALRPADTILGTQPGRFVPVSAAPERGSMFGPRGVWAQPGGPLLVADTGNHRVLIWHTLPTADATPPDIVLGQSSFTSDERNRGAGPSADSLYVPTGVLFWQGRLLVADAWNHRVLVWRALPEQSGQPADFALGQATLDAGELNRGGSPRADTFYWPYGLASDGARLYVADSNNRRVLVWDAMPDACGQPAEMVLGQGDFTQGEENAGGAPNSASMRWPHSIASDGARLLVADAGNNRVLVWNSLPVANNQPADLVLGQNDFAAVSDNQGYRLGSATLRFPYAVALWNEQIVVSDTGNSRLMLWDDYDGLRSGAAADGVFGQADFLQNGENRWKLAGRETLCWPYGLSSCAGVLAIADSGNNRVLLWHGPGGSDD